MLILILIRISFFLLIERKLIRLIQFRIGPNKILFIGIFQFILDIVKLLIKEHFYFYLIKIKYLIFLIFILFIRFIFWFLINFNYWILINNNFFIIIISIILIKLLILIFYLLIQKSIYIQIRFIRSIVQFLSYDILLILILIFFIIIFLNFNIINFIIYQKFLRFQFINIYLLIIWLIVLLIELLRLPFDFYESESELISGFNLELRSLKFIILFIIEYLDIIYFINLTILIFLFINFKEVVIFILLILFLWIRTFVIRFRYDLIIKIIWKKLFFYLIIFIFLFLLIIYI